MQDRNRVARLVRDLSEIKAAVKRNNPVLRELVSSRFYWWLIFVFGIAVTVFSLVLQYLVVRFHGYAAIPLAVKAPFWIVAAVVGAGTYVFRVAGVIRTIRRIDSRLTLWSFLGDHNVGEFLHVAGPLMMIAAGMTVFLSGAGQGAFVVGAWGLALGIIWNLLAFAVHLAEYYVMGYWCLVTAALSFFLPGVPPTLWTAICIGGGSFAYVAATALLRRMERMKGPGDE